MTTDVYVYDAIRTPRGKAGKGSLRDVRPVALLQGLLHALAERNGLVDDDGPVKGREVGDLLLGCVTQTGEQGANLARIAALYAGWGDQVGGATINRFCASGLDALRLAAASVAVGEHGLVVAGGVESMSRVPMFSDDGAWFSDPAVAERTGFVHMGVAADLLATRQGYVREQLDAVAVRSHARAHAAQQEGRFDGSCIPVVDAEGTTVLDRDELVRPGLTADAMAGLTPAFGTIADSRARALARYTELPELDAVHHVGVCPGVADGASLVLLGSAAAGERLGRPPRARLLAFATAAVEPVQMLHGNVDGSRAAIARAGLTVSEIDLFEVNESFAAVPLHYAEQMGVSHERLNVNGGAIALGHPLGATGGVLLGMAIDELERRGERTAVVSICGGAGVAVSAVLQRV